jgi:hypothetical protein
MRLAIGAGDWQAEACDNCEVQSYTPAKGREIAIRRFDDRVSHE